MDTIAISDEVVAKEARRVSRQYHELFERIRARHSGARGDVICDGERAHGILMEAMADWRSTTAGAAAGYSPLKWLWLLRRLPSEVFDGGYSTTAPYDLTLCEIASASSPATSAPELGDDGRFRYHNDEVTWRRVFRFAFHAIHLSQIHRDLRWIGKGAQLVLRRGSSPAVHASQELERAVESYDARSAAAGSPFDRVGTDVSLWNKAESPRSVESAIVFVTRTGRETRNRLVRVPSAAGHLEVPLRHFPDRIPLAGLKRFSARLRNEGVSEPWGRDARNLLLLTALMTPIAMRLAEGLPSIAHYGYILIERTLLEKNLSDFFSIGLEIVREAAGSDNFPNDAHSLIEELLTIKGVEWPLLPGPIAREDGRYFALDTVAASARLAYAIEFPRLSGHAPNIRSNDFELQTQAVLDESAWAPPKQFRELRGRTLKLNGNAITDLDSIGFRDGTLLAVSCKSVVYTADYDVGDHRLVRNIASALEGYLAEWERKMKVLRDNPKGDNYDLTAVTSIIPLVCTPNVFFVSEPAQREVTAGLRRIAALSELRSWAAKPESGSNG